MNNEKYLDYNAFKNLFFDEFGNRINNFIIEKYYKSSHVWTLEETMKTHYGDYYVVDNKCYFKCNGSLIPLNMDFESKDCGAAYKIVGKDTAEYQKIIGNEYLCKSEYFGLKLHKQSYSDNTCFYTLEDNYGDFRVDYGNENLQELINVLERENEIDKKYIGILPTAEENIKQRDSFITDIKQFLK